ncbi:hypothetical protein [Spongiimicrobium salis]|uniref:hypothetical protein n=1 Tax=Spongiimicrobium salis TaxID=1667022 RepID=UPI00374D66A7
MKRSFNSNPRLALIRHTVLLLFLMYLPKSYGQEQTAYPLIKADSSKLYIGNYSIDFSPRTASDIDGSTSFPYDSIVSVHDFDRAINMFFPQLTFNDQKKYDDLKDDIQGWSYTEVLNQLNISRIGSNINLRWRSLPLRDAIASALIAYVKSDAKYHLYIDQGQLHYIYVRDSKVIAVDSIARTIRLKTASPIVEPIPPEQENTASPREVWLYAIMALLILALGFLSFRFLQRQKSRLSIDEIAKLQKGEPIEGEHRLSQEYKARLDQIKREIAYATQGGPENEAHKKIVLQHMDLVDQLENSEDELTMLQVLKNYLNTNGLIHSASKIGSMATFIEQKKMLQNNSAKEKDLDVLMLRSLELFYSDGGNGEAPIKKLKARLETLSALEKRAAQFIAHTKTDSFSGFSEKIEALFTTSRTLEHSSKILELLSLFQVEEKALHTFKETTNLIPGLNDLSEFLSTKNDSLEAGFFTKDVLLHLQLLFQKLQALVPGIAHDPCLLSVEILKAGLFHSFFEALQQAEEKEGPLDTAELIETIRSNYNELKPKEIALPHFQLDDFIEKELRPYWNLTSKATLNYETENQYLLQFHQRYHGLLTKLESSQVLEEEDRIWFFETLFSITFHILDYVKIKLALPKTDGADINFGLILEGNSIHDLSSEAYDVITKNYRTTPIEVRHILKLAQQVGIKKLDDLLFNGVYINPESLNDTTDEKN